jgi:hypothetical protein
MKFTHSASCAIELVVFMLLSPLSRASVQGKLHLSRPLRTEPCPYESAFLLHVKVFSTVRCSTKTILVPCSLWLMGDTSMPSFHSNPFSSTSDHLLWEGVRDLSTLNLAYINGRISRCQHFHGNTSMSRDWQILIDARRQHIYSHSSDCTMYLDAHHHYRWVVPRWLTVFHIDR